MKQILFSITGILIVLSILLGCGKNDQQGFQGSGSLEAEEVVVSSLLAGSLDSLTVLEGDLVQKDQLVAVVDTRKLEAQLLQSEAGLEELRIQQRIARKNLDQLQEQHSNLATTLERQRNLLASGSSTQQVVDDLSAQERIARSKLEAAKDQLNALAAKERQLSATQELIRLQIADGVILAPLSGTILEKYVSVGENVAPGSPVVKIADLDHLWVKIYVSEMDIGRFMLGKNVQIKVDALPDRGFVGTVSWISSKAEFTPKNVQTRQARADLVFAVKVEFENPERIASIGMPAEVYTP
ncbi:MAG: HlyD family efflux transporter periplasmic adaptor subunit [bacterium]